MIYLYIAAAIAFAASIGYGQIQHSGKLAAEARLETCNAKVAEQNRAVEALAAEGAKKQAAGAAALAKAEGRAKTWDEQAKRLTAVLTARKPTDDKSCAGAWQEIRK